MQKNETAIDHLEALVAETASAIRTGNFTVMGGLAARTEAVLAELGPQTDVVRIRTLRDLAGRNAMSLQAAVKGVRAARRRIAEVVAARAGVQTYDQSGGTQKIGGPPGVVKARF
jgi:hypothetical protein